MGHVLKWREGERGVMEKTWLRGWGRHPAWPSAGAAEGHWEEITASHIPIKGAAAPRTTATSPHAPRDVQTWKEHPQGGPKVGDASPLPSPAPRQTGANSIHQCLLSSLTHHPGSLVSSSAETTQGGMRWGGTKAGDSRTHLPTRPQELSAS